MKVRADVGLHPKVRLVYILRLVHIRFALARLVLRRTERRDQRGVHHRAGLRQQALKLQQIVDGSQDLIGQLLLQLQMPKGQDRRLVRQKPAQRQTSEFPDLRHVMQYLLLHRRIIQHEPLLNEVNAQHGQHFERRAAALALQDVRRH
jgi:hypothetical protein